MGKASKFFKALFSFKPSDPTHQPPSRSDVNKQPTRRWSFIKSNKDELHHHHHHNNSDTFNPSLSLSRNTPLHHSTAQSAADDRTTTSTTHVIAVDVDPATTKLADAVVTTAHAAAEVVRMTSKTSKTNTRYGYGLRKEWAAIKIQTYFRGYLVSIH